NIRKSSGITYRRLKLIFDNAVNKYKMAMAFMYSTPGPKMVFQGDERADMTPFRFFRQFESIKNEDYLYTEKGYKPGKPALEESKFGGINYSKKGKKLMSQCHDLVRDLNIINEENPALSKGKIITKDTIKHPSSQVIAMHAKDDESGNEIYTITNFLDAKYPRDNADDYYIKFPEGKWVEILNTDDAKYGGNGTHRNEYVIGSDGKYDIPLKMPATSTMIFKRIG
ncbi:alpha amylase C-terminal domain-containing protein, partial [bacterium]|nr:alpha amylase C-terminal domain-containing protein [bacterium]